MWHVGGMTGRLMPIYEDDVVGRDPDASHGGWNQHSDDQPPCFRCGRRHAEPLKRHLHSVHIVNCRDADVLLVHQRLHDPSLRFWMPVWVPLSRVVDVGDGVAVTVFDRLGTSGLTGQTFEDALYKGHRHSVSLVHEELPATTPADVATASR